MIQKSLQILIACALLTLTAIVGYSVLRLHGPEDTLREARVRFAAGAYGEVIASLGLAERSASFTADPALLQQLWRLRYESHARLDNPRGALADLARLLETDQDDREELLLAEIRLLATAGDGERARQRGREFLADHAEHGRALELTGEACQTIYQPKLRELQVRLERDLGRSRRADARKALLSYLYRPDGDQEVARAAARLEEMFRTEPRLVASWPEVRGEARALRALVQEGLGYFQRSLDLGGEPVAAFRAVATAFEQSGRIEDLLMACEIQRRVYDHAYVAESGARAAWACIQSALPRAAMATVDRWLDPEQIETAVAEGRLGMASQELALARGVATWLTGDKRQVWPTNKLVNALRQQGLQAHDAMWMANAGLLTLTDQKDPERLERIINQLIAAPLDRPTPLDRPDLVAMMEPVLLDSMLARNAPEADVLATLAIWRKGRPESAEPHIRTADYLLTLGRTAAALAALDDAEEIAPEDPRLLPLRVSISRPHYENSSQSGPNLVNQCIQNRKGVPDVEDPIAFLLCAETALQQPGWQAARIALNSARAAIGAFPRANLPRQLELRALLAMRRYAEAASTAEMTVRAVVADEETLRLAIEAKRAAAASLRSLVRIALPRVGRSDALQTEMLRIALEDAPQTAAQLVTPTMTAAGSAAGTRLLAVQAMIAAGQLDEARAQLQATGPQQDPELQTALLEAFTAWLVRSSEGLDDAALFAAAIALRDQLDLTEGSQAPLLAALPQLAETHPDTALELLERALPAAAPEERTGALFSLAGELALDAGDLTRAQARWLAAIAFSDGAAAAEPLARLLLLAGEEARAMQVYRLVKQPTDPALAARLGRSAEATRVVAQQLQRDPADLLVHATLATFGQVSLVDWAMPTDPALQQQRLELLSALGDRRLSAASLPLAESLLRSDPKKQTHYLLLARASADAGLASAAAALHAQLFQAGYQTPVLLREVAYAGADDAYVPAPALDRKLIDAATTSGIAGSQLTFDYAADRIVQSFEAGGFPDMAEATRLSQWLATPQLRDWTDEDLDLILQNTPPTQACFVLNQILSGPFARDPERLLRAFYDHAPKAVAASPNGVAPLSRMAAGHLQRFGARADVVHFLLEHRNDELPAPPADLLVAHLERIARGEGDRARVQETVDRLVAEVTLAEASARVEALIDRFPTSLPMWSLHTELATRLHGGKDALAGMRNVLEHARAPRAELAFFALAAAQRDVTEADPARLADLTQELRDSPTGRYVQALFALRAGDPDAAAEHFPAAAPQQDGRHLFLWAMAELMRGDGAPDGRAKELLEQLLRDYPSSSLARNAGSFVRQLSPR